MVKIKVKKAPSVSSRSSSPASSASASGSGSDSDSSSSSSKVVVEATKSSKGKGVAQNETGLSKYKPPTGMKPVEGRTEKSGIDWSEISSSPDLELWAVRIPEGVKPRHLEGLTIQLGGKNAGPLGTVTAKKVTYEVNFAAEPSSEVDSPEFIIGGEEMKSLVVLLPKHNANNKLYRSPRPLVHNLVLTRSLPSTILSHLPSSTSSLITSQPSPVPGAVLTATELLKSSEDLSIQSKRRVRVQPEGLKFRLELSGMGAVGGRGEYRNSLPPTVGLGIYGQVDRMEGVPLDAVVDGGEGEDVEMKGSESPEKKKKRSVKTEEGGNSQESPRKKSKKVE